MMKRLITVSLLTAALTTGCVIEESTDVDTQRLDEFRKAVPTMAQVQASELQATTQALGEPAELPQSSFAIAAGINGSVAFLVNTLDVVVNQLEPTVFNSDTQEYVWGPFENDDGIGYVAVYIRDTGSDEDFRFHYAFLRGVDNDLAKLTPVIVGGATPSPDNEDHGVGLALIDFEADYQFELTHNPNGDHSERERGRVAFLFGAGPDEDNPNDEMAFVVAALRGFGDGADGEIVSIDYLYGHYEDNTEGHTLDFLNWQSEFDVNEDGSAAELVDIRMAFLDQGTGRAEATVSGGDLELGVTASAIECWDTSINQTFIEMTTSDGIDIDRDGVISNCGIFEASLGELGIPGLEDIDADLRAGLNLLAETGSFDE